MKKESLLSGALALLVTTSILAGEKVVVKVGDSADTAKVSASNNVTVDALKKAKAKGSGEFWAKDAQGTSYPFELDAKQIGDLLDGSTIMVDAKGENGSASPMRVTLEVKQEKQEKAAKSSGW
jgi:hypothetical protein